MEKHPRWYTFSFELLFSNYLLYYLHFLSDPIPDPTFCFPVSIFKSNPSSLLLPLKRHSNNNYPIGFCPNDYLASIRNPHIPVLVKPLI